MGAGQAVISMASDAALQQLTCPGPSSDDGGRPKAAPWLGSDGPVGPCIWHQKLPPSKDDLRSQ